MTGPFPTSLEGILVLKSNWEDDPDLSVIKHFRKTEDLSEVNKTKDFLPLVNFNTWK